MNTHSLLLSIFFLAILAMFSGCREDETEWLLGYWPFDGDLKDASGNGHDAMGEGAQFADGRQGRSLRLRGQHVEVPDSPDVQLAPGLTIDCWVYFDEKPSSYQTLVMKQNEYQLRVDHEREGGGFAFFVYLDGWEPRVRGCVPEAGRWYHLVARWTGVEISLEVNGEEKSSPRSGTAKPTKNPVTIGNAICRIDELKLLNPHLVMMRRMQAMIADTPDDKRCALAHFGEGVGWPGWRGAFGAEMKQEGDAIKGAFPNSHATLLNPTLGVNVDDKAFLSLDIQCPTAKQVCLCFITDAGQGIATLPVWAVPAGPVRRTSIINLASHANWRGRLKLLGLSFPDGKSHKATVENLWVSNKPEGRPFLYARSLAPGRAILRAGRDERVIAIVRNLGTDAAETRAELIVPKGVRIVGEATKALGDMPYHGTEQVEWTVRADQPIAGKAKAVLSARDFAPSEREMAIEFRPDLHLPKASYVPRPNPAKSKYLMLMHYCPLWKEGTHYGWERIEPWPERTPAIGWYDEGTPEVADWHIKYALEHGIQGFIYCWYRRDFSPEIHQHIGHAIHEGLLNAKYLDMFKFCIMWENGCAKGVQSRDDMMNNVLPYWIKNYFTHPSYVKVDNKPVLFVWRPELVSPTLGGSEPTRALLDEMRAELKKHGFDGLYVVGCLTNDNEKLLKQMAAEGWDASSAYAIFGKSPKEAGVDMEGITTFPNRAALLAQKDILLAKKAIGAVPDIVDVMMGWDPRPWHGPQTSYYLEGASPQNFRTACINAKKIVDATPGNGLDKRIVVFDNWNEFGEGHYIEPCAGFGFQFVDVIRDLFCDETEPCVDITPADVGLELPERAYRKRREILQRINVFKKREVVDNLLAWWTFDKDDESIALDSSKCGFHGVKQDFQAGEGVKGKGFLCNGGTVSLEFHELLSPLKGITIELWLKADAPNQSDRWIINTVGRSTTGYRLGMSNGRIAWQIPQQAWSHSVISRDPAPLGQWVHVAATFDNKMMRIFLNGQEVGSGERFGAITPSGSKMCIGAYGSGNKDHSFVGTIDEVKIYDRALSAEEIAGHCRAGGK